eukprot:Nk52_evm1s66 gene=Nk52_evmTU1s66
MATTNVDRALRVSDVSSVLQFETGDEFRRRRRSTRNHHDSKDKEATAGLNDHLGDSSDDGVNAEGQIVDSDDVPDVFSRDYFGILCVYFIVGIYYGLQTGIIYPVVVVAGGKEREVVTAAGSLITIFWSYKIFFGFVTDFFPILGYRRRPYIIGGFCASAAVMVILATCANELSTEAFLFMLTLNNFFYVFADVAGDGMVVQMAQREPESIRGRTQSAIYIARTLGTLITLCIGAFGLNGETYNGDFDFELSLNGYCAVLAALATVPIVGIVFFLKEERIPETQKNALSLKHHVKDVYKNMLRRPVYQVMAYTMMSTLFMAI